MIENLDVESWERLASAADAEHEKNLVTRNQLTRQRAAAALNALVNGDTDAVADLDNELCAVEARICGHQQTMKLIRVGLDAATVIACADETLEKIALTRASAAKRSELASAVDTALSALSAAVTAYLDSSVASSNPSRCAGDLSRAYWFAMANSRNRPTWARRAVSDLSSPLHSMPTARPLSRTVDPVLAESDTLEAAALKRREEALETLKALTLTKPLTPAKSRSNRKIDALEIAA